MVLRTVPDKIQSGFRYAAMMLCGFAFISWLVGVIGAPKTEGKTLKQIEIERYGHEVK